MVNYEVMPEVLAPLVPKGVVPDAHQGKYFVSLVGFLFAGECGTHARQLY